MSMPIQEEPESTIGKKPEQLKRPGARQGRTPSGVASRREKGNEKEGGTEDRAQREPRTERRVEE